MNKQQQNNRQPKQNENNWLLLGTNCWRLAKIALWPGRQFSEEEQSQVIKLISSMVFRSEQYYKSYLEICQRSGPLRKNIIDYIKKHS